MRMRNYTIIGLLALLGLSSDAPGKKSGKYTLPYTSIEQGERVLRKLTSTGDYERAWITDGELWCDITEATTTHNVRISKERFYQFLKITSAQPIFFYHQHPQFKDYGLNPPTPSDLDVCNNLNSEAKRDVVCRVVEQRVIWEYGKNTFRRPWANGLSLRDLAYPPAFFIGLDSILKREFSEDQVMEVVSLYAEYGVTLKVKK